MPSFFKGMSVLRFNTSTPLYVASGLLSYDDTDSEPNRVLPCRVVGRCLAMGELQAGPWQAGGRRAARLSTPSSLTAVPAHAHPTQRGGGPNKGRPVNIALL